MYRKSSRNCLVPGAVPMYVVVFNVKCRGLQKTTTNNIVKSWLMTVISVFSCLPSYNPSPAKNTVFLSICRSENNKFFLDCENFGIRTRNFNLHWWRWRIFRFDEQNTKNSSTKRIFITNSLHITKLTISHVNDLMMMMMTWNWEKFIKLCANSPVITYFFIWIESISLVLIFSFR